jgi:hypothetical protein
LRFEAGVIRGDLGRISGRQAGGQAGRQTQFYFSF